ncbi:MAG: serine/threonine protein kinase [Planctomycetes bacterium]|jgi:serine/threonine protein kinase|nr:serine/threonine protein kinase [Planctomycetota bacterium]MBT4029282.1 serine/threonine protein kinase [Planctomycetota bacterium]MBT4560445.1 serine/threonine protein kinase [Planctomycetota bacterium]MBT5101422.1 serine/threonine protein kinase [Planctomycetota bacterium]MBT5119983.1 serine/threonine protein kinase [Planctomycetota bacterium]
MSAHEEEAENAFQAWLQACQADGSVDTLAYQPDSESLAAALFHGKVQEYREIQSSIRGRLEGLMPGALLGDYRLIKEVGRGGTGMVWEAEQVTIKRRVAIKLLHPYFQLLQEVPDAFLREARAAGSLAHDGIVRIYNLEKSGSHRFLVMELVPGGRTLADVIREMHRLGALGGDFYSWVARLFAKTAEALQVAHDAGVMHLDLKPANILLDCDDLPKITDFGISRMIELSHGPVDSPIGAHEGTWPYMSPEQVVGFPQPADPSSDIFSLGSTLYEVLTGVRPFQGATPDEIRTQIRLFEPKALRAVSPSIPEPLDLICRKMIRKLKESRYQDMGSLISDLNAFLNGEPISAAQPTFRERFLLRTRRHPVQFVFSAMSVLLLVVLAVAIPQVVLAQNRLEQAIFTTGPLLSLSNAESKSLDRDGLLHSLRAHQQSLARISFADDLQKAQMLVQVGRAFLNPFEAWPDAALSLQEALDLQALPQGEADTARILLAKAHMRLALTASRESFARRSGFMDLSITKEKKLLTEVRRAEPSYQIARDLLSRVINRPYNSKNASETATHAWAQNRLAVIDIDWYQEAKARDAFLVIDAFLIEHGLQETSLYFLNQLDLAIALSHLEEYGAARTANETALAGYTRMFGPSHPEVAYCWNHQAIVLLGMGDLAAAKEAHQNAKHTALMSAGEGAEIHDSILRWGRKNAALLNQD